jgi:hypothetical protein
MEDKTMPDNKIIRCNEGCVHANDYYCKVKKCDGASHFTLKEDPTVLCNTCASAGVDAEEEPCKKCKDYSNWEAGV